MTQLAVTSLIAAHAPGLTLDSTHFNVSTTSKPPGTPTSSRQSIELPLRSHTTHIYAKPYSPERARTLDSPALSLTKQTCTPKTLEVTAKRGKDRNEGPDRQCHSRRRYT